MKDRLKLQNFKNSKNRKYNTIYLKAQRIMDNKFETEIVTEQKVTDLVSKYPTLSAKLLMGGDVLIRSKKDSWLVRDEARFFTLYHKVIHFEKAKIVERYHVQDVFYDIDFVFASIVSHDDFALGIRSRTTEEIMEIVIQNS